MKFLVFQNNDDINFIIECCYTHEYIISREDVKNAWKQYSREIHDVDWVNPHNVGNGFLPTLSWNIALIISNQCEEYELRMEH